MKTFWDKLSFLLAMALIGLILLMVLGVPLIIWFCW